MVRRWRVVSGYKCVVGLGQEQLHSALGCTLHMPPSRKRTSMCVTH